MHHAWIATAHDGSCRRPATRLRHALKDALMVCLELAESVLRFGLWEEANQLRRARLLRGPVHPRRAFGSRADTIIGEPCKSGFE